MTAPAERRTMEFHETINGHEVHATYTDESVEQIFVPLLQHLTRLQQHKGSRVLAMLAAPPATGKSTLVAFLEHLSRTTPGVCPVQAIGMDGFHRRQEYLDTHLMEREGVQVPMARYKGAPETFDLKLMQAALESVASGESCGWPVYDRTIHDPLDDAIRVTGDIVLVEGNYLLLDEPGWRSLSALANYTVFIEADPALLRERLVNRKAKGTTSLAEAEAHVARSDLRNVQTVLEHSLPADLTLRLMPNGSYVLRT